jgi:hypothetical protein
MKSDALISLSRRRAAIDLFVNIINLFDRDNLVPSVLGLPGGVQDRPLSASAGIRSTF